MLFTEIEDSEEFCLILIRSLTPQQTAEYALAIAVQIVGMLSLWVPYYCINGLIGRQRSAITRSGVDSVE